MNRFSLSLLLIVLLLAGNVQAETLRGYSTKAEAMKRIDKLGPISIEGLWQFTGEGAIVAIERSRELAVPGAMPTAFNVIVVQTPDESVAPGTIIGSIKPTAISNTFDCELIENPADNFKRKVRRFTIHVNDEGHLSFVRVKSSTRISLWRWIPYLFRVTVIKQNERDARLDGCIKIYPLSPETFRTPRYL